MDIKVCKLALVWACAHMTSLVCHDVRIKVSEACAYAKNPLLEKCATIYFFASEGHDRSVSLDFLVVGSAATFTLHYIKNLYVNENWQLRNLRNGS